MGEGKKQTEQGIRHAQRLTKSLFTLASECPTKLFYVGKKDYKNKKLDDEFLKSLADGGFQVGALARAYFPGGIEITETDSTRAAEQTAELLKKDEVTLFEACFIWNSLLIRTDVLEKRGNRFRLFEVKAKSYEGGERFHKIKGKSAKTLPILAAWQSYLLDIAFQTFVLRKSRPESTVTPYLLLPDKTLRASIDGLNQKFFIQRVGGRSRAVPTGFSSVEELGERVLTEVAVAEYVDWILDFRHYGLGPDYEDGELGFGELTARLGESLAAREKIPPRLGKHCKLCEFRCNDGSLKSGFHECWGEVLAAQPGCRPVFELWNWRGADKAMSEKIFCIQGLDTRDFVSERKDNRPGMSQADRQSLQIRKVQQRDQHPEILVDELRSELERWRPPYHFIDFETMHVALPFFKGHRPYQQIAFQFSHHQVGTDGVIRHQGQHLNRARGAFPTFDMVRALKAQLENDEGTILRYGDHENNVLQDIARQLDGSDAPDKKELIAWIKSVTKPKQGSSEKMGHRCMVDMLDIIRRYIYLPSTNGSNSLKQVFPATLENSRLLTEKYSAPIYGTERMPSLNFPATRWIELDEKGRAKSPYDRLPQLFEECTNDELDLLDLDTIDIKAGGAAMMAYARMQFTQTSDAEVDELARKLLMYCELDTLAMVMLWQAWRDWVGLPPI